MVATASPAIQKATAKVLELSKDERARLIYEYELKARDYKRGRLEYVAAKAKAKGKVEGERAKSLAIARNMLNLKLPIETIILATGLSHNEIEKLRSDS